VKIQNLIGFCIALTVLAGCRTDPPRILKLRDDLIEDGKTTMKEVVKHLGLPALRQRERNGVTAAHYMDAAGEFNAEGKRMHGFSAEPGTMRFKTMSILSGKDGVITAHWEYQSSQAIKGRSLEGGPRLRFGPVLDPSAVGQIKHRVTGEKDLVSWFGVPALEFMAPDRTLIFVWIEGTLASSISSKNSYRALSVALDDRGAESQHSVMETDELGEAMRGLILR
jgi:hypothetical protein